MKLIRVMCSGRIDLEFVFRAFANGVDGVFIGGCILDECNFATHGNYHALNMVLMSKKIMAYTGLNPDRLNIAFMSSGDGTAYVKAVNGFVDRIKKLGPISNDTEESDLARKLSRVRQLIPYIKMVKREKLDVQLKDEAAREDFYAADEIDEMFEHVVSYYIDPEKCRGCMICARNCPVDAIEGGKKMIHVIDQTACIKCDTCYTLCPDKFDAVQKIVSEQVPEPLPMEARAISG
tara:strand:- start:226 stop:930 length:705 start_codon:yes stop_codon:yes gene_type:complete